MSNIVYYELIYNFFLKFLSIILFSIELIIRFKNLYLIIYLTLITKLLINYLNIKLLSYYLFIKRNILIKYKLLKKN